jgi:uncharacterized Zn finger protein
MCKHVAAALYGIGARLDAEPELLFGLRKVDAKELIARAGETGVPVQKQPRGGPILNSSKLDVFGIDFGSTDPKPFDQLDAKKGRPSAPRTDKSAKRIGKQSVRKKSGNLDDDNRDFPTAKLLRTRLSLQA